MRQLRKLYTNLTDAYRSDMGHIVKRTEEQICGKQGLFASAPPDYRVQTLESR